MTLTSVPGTAPVSSTVNYNAIVSFSSPGTQGAFGVQANFFFSPGMVYQGFIGSGWNCVGSTVISCSLGGTLNVGASSALSLQFQMPATPTTVQVQGSVSFPGTDTNSSNNSPTAVTQVQAVGATLGLIFNGSATTANVGEAVVYSAQVSNSGPASVSGLNLNGNLTGPLSISSFVGTGWSCTGGTSTYNCIFAGTLLAGNSTPMLSINSLAGPAAGNASISATASAPAAAMPVTQSRNLTVTAAAQLRLLKTDSIDPVPLGQRFSYNLTVFNDGLGAASGLTLLDNLPSSVGLVLASGGGWTCNNGSALQCNFAGSLGAGASTTVRVDVDALVAGVVNNTANVSASGISTVSDSEATTIIDQPSLSFTKRAERGQVTIGETVDFTLSVRNNGSSSVGNLRIVDRLPASLGFVSASGVGWSCVQTGSNINCNNQSIGVGGSSDVVITARANGPAGTATNTATLTFGSGGSGLSASAAVTLVEVSTPPDLVLSKSDSADPVQINAPFSYMLTVTNRGGPATGVTLVDDLPASLILVSATGAGWSCSGAQMINCSFTGTMASGATTVVTVAVVAPANPTNLLNRATVNVGGESNPLDNGDTETTAIIDDGGGGGPVSADMALSATIAPSSGNVGDLVSISLAPVNLGPDPAESVRVTGAAATGLRLISATAAGFQCTVTSNSFSCQGGTQEVSSTPLLTVSASLEGPAGSTTELNAVVSSATADPVSTNNAARVSASIASPPPPSGADLSLVKTDSADPVNVDEQFSYSLVVSNLGPTAAEGVRIVDPLPPGLTLVSANGAGLSCSGTATVTCTANGPLPTGQSLSATLTVVAPSAAGSIENVAEVFATTVDPNTGNNRGRQTTQVDVRDEEELSEELSELVVDDPTAAAAADPVAQLCADPNPAFAAGCAIVLDASDAGDSAAVSEALRAISPDEVVSQSATILEMANTQFFNVDARLAELRGGGGGFSLAGLTVVSDGKAVPLSLFNGLFDSDEPEVGGSGDLISPWGFFVNGTISRGDQNLSNAESNVVQDFDSYGLTAGVDYRLNYRSVVGAAIGYNSFDSNLTESGDMSTTGYSLTGYGSYYVSDRFYVDARLSYSWGSFDQTRFIRFGSGADRIDLRATGSTDSSQLAFATGMGYHYNAGGWVFTPNAHLRYVNGSVDGFSESGAGAYSAIFGDQDVNSLQAGFGLQITRAFSISTGVISPQFDINFVHESQADDLLVEARLAGADPSILFELRPDDPDRSFGNVGLGFVYVTSNGRQAYLQYRETIGLDGLDRGTLNLGARFEF